MKTLLVLKNPDPERLAAARLEMFRRSPALFPDDITVPMLFYYGGKDPVAIAADGQIIVDSLRRRGIFADIKVYDERGHALTYDESETVHAAIVDFFDTQLAKNKQ
jgi:dipeptidyl aminopeptidase/acylaminoacyl peptidase